MVDEPDVPMTRQATVPLSVSHQAELDLTRALDALTNVDWLGSPVAGSIDQPGWRRVSTVLALRVADGSAPGPVRKGAVIEIGPPSTVPDGLTARLSWQSDSMAPMFPVFAGLLRVSRTGLTLEGRYAPPFGRLGLLIDTRILHFVALRTGQALLSRFASQIAG